MLKGETSRVYTVVLMHTGFRSSPRGSRLVRLPFFYGWVIVAIAALLSFMSAPGQTFGISIFVEPMIEELGWTRTTVSGLYTLGSLTAATMMLLVGRLLDRFGARTMLSVVGVMFGGAALWMSQVSAPLSLYLGFAALRTFGQGSLSLVSSTLVALWFIRLRGRVTAIVSIGMMTSAAVFPVLLHNLIGAFGWRAAWVGLAFAIWALVTVPAILFVRRTPESVSLLPDGDKIRPTEEYAGRQHSDEDWSFREALRTRSLWLLMFAGTSQSLIGTALIFHHISVMESRGVDAGTAAVVLSSWAVFAVIGTVAAGFLSDRYPNRFIIAAVQVLLAMAMVLVINITVDWQAVVYGMFLGLGGGLMITTNNVIWPNYYGRKELGSIRGMVMTVMVAAAALGPLPFGYLFDVTDSYRSVVLVFLALPAACLVAALLAVPPRKKTLSLSTGGEII